MPNLEEKRKHSRAQIDWPVAVQTSQGIVAGRAKNISIDGLCVKYGVLCFFIKFLILLNSF